MFFESGQFPMLKASISLVARLFGSFYKYGAVEREISQWLAKEGYNLKDTVVADIQLRAIERPGWVQVFSFRVSQTADSKTEEIRYGFLRSDERFGKSAIRVFSNSFERNHQLGIWSENLIRRRNDSKAFRSQLLLVATLQILRNIPRKTNSCRGKSEYQ